MLFVTRRGAAGTVQRANGAPSFSSTVAAITLLPTDTTGNEQGYPSSSTIAATTTPYTPAPASLAGVRPSSFIVITSLLHNSRPTYNE